MKYIEAPEIYERGECDGKKALFLAGGITNCPDWQAKMVNFLSNTYFIILNPRRRNFPINDPGAAHEQIRWEFIYLRKADFLCFWFPKQSICPIALYELGAWSMTQKPVFVGCHPQYPRRLDIEEQTSLIRPEINIVYSLKNLSNQILEYQG